MTINRTVLYLIILIAVGYLAFDKLRKVAVQGGCEIGASTAFIITNPRLNGTLFLEQLSHSICIKKIMDIDCGDDCKMPVIDVKDPNKKSI